MEIYFNEFLLIATAHFIALISPGTDFIYLVNTSLSNKPKIVLGASLGIALSNGFYIILCLLGYATLFSKYEILNVLIKVAGGLYLLYLSIRIIKSKSKYRFKGEISSLESCFLTEVKRGFYISFFNPKISIFYISLFTLLINPDTPLFVQLLYGIWMTFFVFIWDSMIVYILNYKKFRALVLSINGLEKMMGILLLIISIGLFYSLFFPI